MGKNKENQHTIYIVRHGETDQNAENIAIGQRTRATLNTKGIKDAERVAAWFRDKNIAAILSSPLDRAHTTAEYIATSTGIIIFDRDELKEIDMGAVDGLTEEQARNLYPEHYQKRETELHYRIHTPWPGGESYIDAQQRVSTIAKELEGIQHDVVIVGHKAINKLLFGLLTNSPIEEIAEYAQGHTEILEVTLPDRAIQSHRV